MKGRLFGWNAASGWTPPISPAAGDPAAASFPVFRASIEISNVSGAELQTVRFPCLTWSNHFSADTDGEFLMLPRNDGCLVQDPGSQNATPQSPYPGSASRSNASPGTAGRRASTRIFGMPMGG